IEARRIGARTVQRLHQRLDEVLNGVQFGITLASLGLGWVGEPALAGVIQAGIGTIPYASLYSHTIAVIIAFSLITYMHVILGEVVPKSLALQRAERVALAVAGPMEVFMTLSRPFLWVMNTSSRVVLRVLGARPLREGGVHSPEELKLIVTASTRVGLLPEVQEDMMHRVLELGNVTVREIMVPRPDIFALPADMTLEEATSLVVEEQHSRIPVYDPQRGPEYIIGVLYSKDVSRLMHVRLRGAQAAMRGEPLQVRHIMRDVLLVPETKAVTDLLMEFKQRRRHLAVVVDEFGSTSGVVTVEDVLEQIVGEIEDEFDVSEPTPLVAASGALVLDGAENIRDLDAQFHLGLPRDQGFETLAGFVLSRLQKIPTSGEAFEFQGRRYTVLQMEGHRIARVKVEGQPVLEQAGD
ncbi:MAG: hemolysin family protein, partial [Acidobacteriales bacterium]|nr:hemolysin family protein [Terriglobales bacterium]